MVTVFDVASYILSKNSPMPAMKLQKLVYYCQAWSLVWDDSLLFEDRIEAWANGPVVKSLFNAHKGRFLLNKDEFIELSKTTLSEIQKETVDAVLTSYGDKTSQWLIDLTHNETPWINARKRGNLNDGERGDVEITHGEMAEYYSSL